MYSIQYEVPIQEGFYMLWPVNKTDHMQQGLNGHAFCATWLGFKHRSDETAQQSILHVVIKHTVSSAHKFQHLHTDYKVLTSMTLLDPQPASQEHTIRFNAIRFIYLLIPKRCHL